MRSAARLSDDNLYRYWLRREWDSGSTTCRWIMLNPSTADATLDDPTIRRVIDFSRRWGHGAADVYNLFALRSPKPVALYNGCDAVGPDNDAALLTMAGEVGPVVVAWGTHGGHKGRNVAVLRLLVEAGVKPLCLGTTKDGHPKHPLFVPADTTPTPFPHFKE